MTRGQHDSLHLCCEGLSPFTPCRFLRRTQAFNLNPLVRFFCLDHESSFFLAAAAFLIN